MLKTLKNIIIFALISLSLGGNAVLYQMQLKNTALFQKQIDEIKKQNNDLLALNSQLSGLQKNIDDLAKKEPIVKQEIKQEVVKQEVVKQEVIKQQSQEDMITSAVSRIAPAVVSIVITKDVPKLEVVYENPFGDDPFFQNINIKIPRYQQKGTEAKKVGAGTGFLINSDGYILTNKHVVSDNQASYTALLSNGKQRAAKVIYKDGTVDMAILKIDGSGYTHVDLGDSTTLKLGQSVFAIGNALGEYNNSVSVGIISGLNRNIEASGEKLTGVIQTDAAINPGNSGGPLVGLDGKVIGVNVATVMGSENISFSIPINTVKGIVSNVLK